MRNLVAACAAVGLVGTAAFAPARADILGLGGKCLDVSNGKAAEGTSVVLNTCSNGASQEWTPADGKIVGPAGLCLDVTDKGRAAGEAIVATCRGGDSQRWTLADGRIIGVGGKCLEARGDAEAEAIPVFLDRCTDAAGQRWTLE